MGEIYFIVLNGGLITSKYYIQINRMSEISVIVYEWKDLALRALLDRETDREIRYSDTERERQTEKVIERQIYKKKHIDRLTD